MKLRIKYQRPEPSAFKQQDFYKVFPYIGLCKTSDPCHRVIFDSRAIILTTLVEVH